MRFHVYINEDDLSEFAIENNIPVADLKPYHIKRSTRKYVDMAARVYFLNQDGTKTKLKG